MPVKIDFKRGDLKASFGAWLLAILIGFCVLFGTTGAEPSPWWMKGEEGWFFYKDPRRKERSTCRQ